MTSNLERILLAGTFTASLGMISMGCAAKSSESTDLSAQALHAGGANAAHADRDKGFDEDGGAEHHKGPRGGDRDDDGGVDESGHHCGNAFFGDHFGKGFFRGMPGRGPTGPGAGQGQGPSGPGAPGGAAGAPPAPPPGGAAGHQGGWPHP